MMPGSAYRQTGRIVDLLAEPTFDVGGDPAAIYFYSFRVPHYDADGHGLFDIPMVVCEQVFFAPTWLFSAALRLTGSEAYLGSPRPRGAGTFENTIGLARGGVGYLFGVPGAACYFGGVASAWAFDTVAHDMPVIFIGRPLRWLGSLGSEQ
jgi:hypothetical protein